MKSKTAIDLSKLSETDLDELIANAAKQRAKISNNAIGDRPETVDAIIDPAWFITPVENGTIMQIYHPGFGWLAFFIPAQERAALLSFLLQQALWQVPDNKSATSSPSTPTPITGGGGKLH